MYDKIVIRADIDPADRDTIILRNYLEECAQGDEVYYRSTAYAHLDGVHLELRGNRLRCKCSICKLWEKGRTGRLDNWRPMTFAMAVRTLRQLLLRLCIDPRRAVATYYEVGLTMKMSRPADEYIRQVTEASGRLLWNDANYPEARQKTSEKSKYYRKVLKIYDKTYEAASRGRHVPGHVLRVETVYRHQSTPLTQLADPLFMSKLGRTFYRDWSEMQFIRRLKAAKGIKLSQLDKAREVQRIGVTRYKERYKQLYSEGKITRKQWETIRTFANHWPEHRANYAEEPGPLEQEFKDKLLRGYQAGLFMPSRENVKPL